VIRQLGAALVLTLFGAACGTGDRPFAVEPVTDAADLEFVIPRGTGERIDRGEDPGIFPRRLVARVGEVIRIVNRDDRGHIVGPFYVGRRESITQRFASPGTYRGECSAHPSGEFEVTVRP
jgi:hypothetical protein